MRILFICTGNICRSPMAEGICRSRALGSKLNIETDSAATTNFHIGLPPDARAISCMKSHEMGIANLRARKVTVEDFDRFDLLIAMDAGHERHLMQLAPNSLLRAKVRLLLRDYHPSSEIDDVLDPYYGSLADFEEVYHLLDEAIARLISVE